MKKLIIFLLILDSILLAVFFYAKKQQDDTILANETAATLQEAKNKEIEDIRNRPFPLAGMSDTGTTTQYIWETFTDKVTGITFQYPKELLTTYIHATEWPPNVSTMPTPFVCNEATLSNINPGKTEKVTLGSHLYCKTEESEGAAGSTYTTYTYRTLLQDTTATITFTLRSVQCANYDDPKKTECQNERNTFNVDNFIDKSMTSISFTKNNIQKIKSGVSGIVLLGPICPVMRNPPDPSCADRPYTTKLVLLTKNGMQTIKKFSSTADGKFSIEAVPGEYILQGDTPTNTLPRCASNETIHILSNQFSTTTVYCDLGIR